jgi:acyl carrier protein
MNRDELVRRLRELASEMAASTSPGELQRAPSVRKGIQTHDKEDSLTSYAFSSIDALEYLLAVESEFGIAFEDEDLSQEMMVSEDELVEYILARLPEASSEQAQS